MCAANIPFEEDDMRKMKKSLFLITTIIILTGFISMPVLLTAAEKAPQKVIDLANKVLVKYGTDPVIVKAVNAENAKGKTPDQVKEYDKKWRETPGVADFMKLLMESECGKHIQSIQKSKPYFAEIFVMDNLGANVAMTDKTSDYWQGDEDKFIKSYNAGKGGIHISDVEFDDSTQAYLVQVSIPVKDGTNVIGAVTFGVDVDRIE